MLIIALDAAEYDVIDKGNYQNLKQVEYGKVQINVRPLLTPIVWASFITGVTKEKHGIDGIYRWDNKVIKKFKNWSAGISASHRMIAKTLVSIGSILKRFGFTTGLYEKSDLKAPTIFDYVEKHVAISVPSYNEYPHDLVLIEGMIEALHSGSEKEKREMERLVWRLFRKKRETVYGLLSGDWDLFMVHFYFLDALQHLFWYDKPYISKIYEEADKTVESIRKKLANDECLLLIVSDHGQKKGIHTPYGFYSCNRKLMLNNPKITDFANVIRFHMGLPSREEETRVLKRLKSLGYF